MLYNKFRGGVLAHLILFLISASAFSQVGINTTTPDESSILDITHTSKGLLIPRVNLWGLSDNTTISNPAVSLLVYKPADSYQMPRGFYFWNGTQWSPLGGGGGGGSPENGWLITGNANTSSNHFLGTTNWQILSFRTNNQQIGRLHPNGGISFGIEASADDNSGLALGRNSSAGNSAAAIGRGAKAPGYQSAAFGLNTSAEGNETMAIGPGARASGFQTAAFGRQSEATNNNALAIGPNSRATGEQSIALGINATAAAQNAMAIGRNAVANQPNTIIIGNTVPSSSWEGSKIGMGTSTPANGARLDVHDPFKLGRQGTVHKGISSFEGNLSYIRGSTGISTITIPASARPETTRATITATLPNNAPDDLSIVWVKMQSTSTLRIKYDASGISPSNQTTSIYITITEF